MKHLILASSLVLLTISFTEAKVWLRSFWRFESKSFFRSGARKVHSAQNWNARLNAARLLKDRIRDTIAVGLRRSSCWKEEIIQLGMELMVGQEGPKDLWLMGTLSSEFFESLLIRIRLPEWTTRCSSSGWSSRSSSPCCSPSSAACCATAAGSTAAATHNSTKVCTTKTDGTRSAVSYLVVLWHTSCSPWSCGLLFVFQDCLWQQCALAFFSFFEKKKRERRDADSWLITNWKWKFLGVVSRKYLFCAHVMVI